VEIGQRLSFFLGSLVHCLLVFFVCLALGSLQHRNSCCVMGCLYPPDEFISSLFEHLAQSILAFESSGAVASNHSPELVAPLVDFDEPFAPSGDQSTTQH